MAIVRMGADQHDRISRHSRQVRLLARFLEQGPTAGNSETKTGK